MQPCQVHLDHALPLLPELGLEHLVPLLAGGGQVDLDSEKLQGLLQGIAKGAGNRSLRRFVAISRATGDEVFAWESDKAAEASALREAALLPWNESMKAVLDFFSSFGISLTTTPGYSGEQESRPVDAGQSPGTLAES